MGATADRSKAGECGGAPLRVQVDAADRLGPADLEGLRGVCVWRLYGDADHPARKAWDKARFKYPRGVYLDCVGVSVSQGEGGAPSLELDFKHLDEEMEAARKMGAEPVFGFCSMPRALSSNPAAENLEGDHFGQYAPADYRLWDEYVRRTVSHLVEKGYVGGYYEVWNEPEDYRYGWKGEAGSTDTLADYMTLYLHTTAAVRAADATAKVGGPVCAHWDSVTVSKGTHAWGLPQFIRRLAEYRREHPEAQVLLDFVDWHDYSFATPVVSDGVDFVDGVLAEVEWGGRPEYLITEWNRDLGDKGTSAEARASHAAWNVIREADPKTRRVTRLYWYVLEYASGGVALVDGPPPSRVTQPSEGTHTNALSVSFAIFEMLRALNEGSLVAAEAADPLVALATADEAGLRLLVNNNTAEEASAVVEIARLPEKLRAGSCRVQRADKEHSAEGKGLEAGEEAALSVSGDSASLTLSLPCYGTALVTLSA